MINGFILHYVIRCMMEELQLQYWKITMSEVGRPGSSRSVKFPRVYLRGVAPPTAHRRKWQNLRINKWCWGMYVPNISRCDKKSSNYLESASRCQLHSEGTCGPAKSNSVPNYALLRNYEVSENPKLLAEMGAAQVAALFWTNYSSFIIDHRKFILIPIDCKFCLPCRGGVGNSIQNLLFK